MEGPTRSRTPSGAVTALWVAALSGVLGACATSQISGPPLFRAAYAGDLAEVRRLLETGADVNATDPEGRSPLFTASFEGHLDVVDLLIARGAAVDRAANNGFTPLIAAAQEGHSSVVERLVDAGGSLEKRTSAGQTPLYAAALSGRTHTVETLIRRGAQIEAPANQGETPLAIASETGQLPVVEVLISHGADPNLTWYDGTTALHQAAREGHAEVVQRLLEAGAHADAYSGTPNPETALYTASYSGRVEVVRILLAAGADPNTRNNRGGWTPIFVAGEQGHTEVVRLLLAEGADPRIASDTGDTAIEAATKLGRHSIAAMMRPPTPAHSRPQPPYQSPQPPRHPTEPARQREPSGAFAPSGIRVALAIGNGGYQYTAPLPNPVNDARAVAAALQRLGFEVTVETDVERHGMERALRDFGRRLSGADIGFFYYAGHGLQVDGRNYLVPIEAQLRHERDLPYETVAIADVMLQLESKRLASIVVLDACRDNPLAQTLSRTMGSRSGGSARGLGVLTHNSVGTLIAFATAPDNVAADGAGPHSPYTEALLRWLDEPGLEIGQVFRRVRQDVIERTGGRQVPWENSSLVGDGIFLAGEERP
jgi:ankyrin repeat protein